MRIAHLVSTFPPYKGGMGNVCWWQAKELAKLGHQVTVFTPRGREVGPARMTEIIRSGGPPQIKQFLEVGTPIVNPEVPKLKPVRIKRVKPLLRYGNSALLPGLVRVLGRFDIVHLHYPFFGLAEFIWLARAFGYKRNTPLVLQYHMDVIGKDIKRLFFGFHNSFTLPKIVNSSTKIIASSLDYLYHSSIKRLAKKNPDKFVEVPLGVNLEQFCPQEKDKELLDKYGLSGDSQVILFVGGLDQAHYFKGVDNLIRAFAEVREVRPPQITQSWRSDLPKLKPVGTPKVNPNVLKLIIVGEGDLKQNYIQLAKELGVGDNVIFVGEISQEDLPKYYNLANVLVLPSIDQSEAFGLVLLEAAACAKPVIASNLPGVRTVVKDGQTGFLVEPKNITELADRIKFLVTDLSFQRKLGQNGRRRVEEKYTWPQIAEKLVRVYEELLSQN